MSQKVQQLDLPLSNAHFGILPKNLPGRMWTDDFVYFNFPDNIRPGDYMIATTTLDTSGSPLRTIGPLKTTVELPQVIFDAYGTILVFPRDNPNLPTFFARLNRGSSYLIPDVRQTHKKGMKHEMRRIGGILTAGSFF
jgi:hypothetical protein